MNAWDCAVARSESLPYTPVCILRSPSKTTKFCALTPRTPAAGRCAPPSARTTSRGRWGGRHIFTKSKLI
eukprot:1377908-Prymnesium_polylepis.1